MGLAVAAKSEEKKSRSSAPSSAALGAQPEEHSCGASAGLPQFLRRGCGCSNCAKAIQTKLVTDTPGDRWEQEADRTAEMAAWARPSQDFSGGVTRLRSAPKADIPSSDGGSQLSGEIRRKVEPIVKSDLSHVRVHSAPNDRELAGSLNAKAFTHGSDIWLGHNQSSEDTQLMAHEAAHVVQQGAARSTPSIQRQTTASPSSRPRGAPASVRSTDPAVSAMVRDLPPRSAGPPPRLPDAPDPAEVGKKNAELQGHGRSAVSNANREQPQLQRAASGAKAEAGKPAKPGKTADAKKGKAGKGRGGAPARRTIPIHPFTAPPRPAAVKPPAIVAPVDAAGKPLRPDVAGDAQMLALAAQAQAMRLQGHALQQRAAQERHNASVLQANIHTIHEATSHATEGLAQSEDHLAYRHEVAGQTSSALKLSEDKAEMVAQKAPDFSAKGAEGKEKSGPMAGEARDLAAQNSSATPDDDDAAEKSGEQGQKINSVSSDIGSMDGAITQTKAKADGLSQEAAQAKETNAKTQGNIEETRATLDQTQARLTHLTGANNTAKSKLAQSEHGPQQVLAGAAALDRQGIAAVNASRQMEDRIHAAQKKHVEAMRTVPASKIGKRSGQSRPPSLVQRQTEPGAPAAPARIDLNLAGRTINALPSWLTGEERQTEQQRAAAQLEEQHRREAEIQEINAQAHGNFANLSAADKAGIALSLTSRHIFGSISSIRWPDMLGKLAQGLVDPRIALMGIVSGLSMTLSGAANLLSIEQWKRDPLGNLLKSAADIATGITIILGSITALAIAIIAILVLAAIFSFGALGPVAAAVIPFCSTVVATVGPWTLEAAAIALDLNLLVMIKDLVSAATAKTASDLQVQSDAVTQDAKNAGNMALQIGMAGLGEAGGEALMSTEFGQTLAAGARDVGEAYGIVRPGAVPAGAGAAPVEPSVAPAATEPTAPAASGGAPTVAEPVTPAAGSGAPAAPEPTAASAPGSAPTVAEPATPAPAAEVPPAARATTPPAAEATATPASGAAPTAAEPVTPAPAAEPGTPPQAAATAPPEAAPETGRAAPEGAEPTQPGQPAAEPRVVAQEPGAGGHTVRVTEEGECLVCTTCKSLPEAVDEELAARQAPAEERAAVEQRAAEVQQMTDPAAKAQAGADVQAEAQGQGPGAEPPGAGGPSRAAAEARLEELGDRMMEAGVTPSDLGYNRAQWEQFLEDTRTNPERALRDLEGRMDSAADRAERIPATGEARQADSASNADEVRDTPNVRTSGQTTGPERARAAAEAAERRTEPDRPPEEESGSDSPEEGREGNLFDDLNPESPGYIYRRPSGFPEGMREEVWEAARGSDGQVRDPLTKRVMDPNEPWHMGHKPDHEFWRLQRSAAERGLTREQFRQEYYQNDSFRPELPESNVSHQGESHEPYDG